MNAQNPAQLGAYLESAAILLGMPIQPEHKNEVLAAFMVLAAHAELITSFTLPPETESAQRFTP